MSNYLDTRDLYQRQCELQKELDDLESEFDDAQEARKEARQAWLNTDPGSEEFDEVEVEERDAITALEYADKALSDWLEEYKEELDALNDLENEVGREWMHGATLIPEDDFKDYAQDCAEDMGMDRDQPWPFSCIDWDQAADELRQDYTLDYTEVDFQGTTYLFRS